MDGVKCWINNENAWQISGRKIVARDSSLRSNRKIRITIKINWSTDHKKCCVFFLRLFGRQDFFYSFRRLQWQILHLHTGIEYLLLLYCSCVHPCGSYEPIPSIDPTSLLVLISSRSPRVLPTVTLCRFTNFSHFARGLEKTGNPAEFQFANTIRNSDSFALRLIRDALGE